MDRYLWQIPTYQHFDQYKHIHFKLLLRLSQRHRRHTHNQQLSCYSNLLCMNIVVIQIYIPRFHHYTNTNSYLCNMLHRHRHTNMSLLFLQLVVLELRLNLDKLDYRNCFLGLLCSVLCICIILQPSHSYQIYIYTLIPQFLFVELDIKQHSFLKFHRIHKGMHMCSNQIDIPYLELSTCSFPLSVHQFCITIWLDNLAYIYFMLI